MGRAQGISEPWERRAFPGRGVGRETARDPTNRNWISRGEGLGRGEALNARESVKVGEPEEGIRVDGRKGKRQTSSRGPWQLAPSPPPPPPRLQTSPPPRKVQRKAKTALSCSCSINIITFTLPGGETKKELTLLPNFRAQKSSRPRRFISSPGGIHLGRVLLFGCIFFFKSHATTLPGTPCLPAAVASRTGACPSCLANSVNKCSALGA